MRTLLRPSLDLDMEVVMLTDSVVHFLGQAEDEDELNEANNDEFVKTVLHFLGHTTDEIYEVNHDDLMISVSPVNMCTSGVNEASVLWNYSEEYKSSESDGATLIPFTIGLVT